MNTLAPTAENLALAVAALRRGECIGLPTETVYGLAADAANATAVRRIFALKGRPADHPLIVHLPDANALGRYARAVPAYARALADAYWPGPLTLILHRAPTVPDEVTGGQDTVGLRVPAHPVAQRVLQAFDDGLAAPSANRFGHISPTTAAHVHEEFGDALPIVLDGGPCEVGIESTIVDCSGAAARILRPGMLSADAIAAVAGALQAPDSADDSPRASGTLEKHYAPRALLRLCDRRAIETAPETVAVLALGSLPTGRFGRALAADPSHYAHDLYAALRALDGPDCREIWVETPPSVADWNALHDRLRRAAAGSGEGRE